MTVSRHQGIGIGSQVVWGVYVVVRRVESLRANTSLPFIKSRAIRHTPLYELEDAREHVHATCTLPLFILSL